MARTVRRSVLGMQMHGNLGFTKSHKPHMMMRMLHKKKLKQQRCNEGSELFPGLVDDIVLEEILPRLPWYQRPVMMAVSKAWERALKSPMDFVVRSRKLLRQRGLVLLFSSGKEDGIFEQHLFHYLDTYSCTWHSLPPLPEAEDNVEECFCSEGAVYGICKGRLYKLDAGAGMWSWEMLQTTTEVAQDVITAFSDGGMLYICGRNSSCVLLERHNMINRSSHRFYMDGFLSQSFIAVEQDDLIGLFDGMLDGDVTTGRYLRKPLTVFGNATAITFVSGNEFYVGTTGNSLQHLKLESNDGVISLVSEINLPRKLRMFTAQKMVAIANQGCSLYVILQRAIVFQGRVEFSLWKGEATGKDDTRLADLAWSRMECPLEFGTSEGQVLKLRSFDS